MVELHRHLQTDLFYFHYIIYCSLSVVLHEGRLTLSHREVLMFLLQHSFRKSLKFSISLTPAGSYEQSPGNSTRPVRNDRSHVLASIRRDASPTRDRSETPGE